MKKILSTLLSNIMTSENLFFQFRKFKAENIKISNKIKHDGYASLGNVFSATQLKNIKIKIDDLIEKNEAIYDKKNHYYLISNPLQIKEFNIFLSDSNIIEILEYYFKKRVYLSDVDSRRIPPTSIFEVEKFGKSSSNWHRDTRGKQVKIMIYLTDVGESDSNFSFFPKTHTKIQKNFNNSRFEDDFTNDKPTEWYGYAGDAMIFDTNIIHRLRRKETGNYRDSVTFYFTPGQQLRKIHVDSILFNSKLLQTPFWSQRS
jgi:ectoine hydroxylase-related dioxygenase (phytanoyl-CoA dioxygenase family)